MFIASRREGDGFTSPRRASPARLRCADDALLPPGYAFPPPCTRLPKVSLEPAPVRVHVATTQEVVELGLRTMLERADPPFELVVAGPDHPDPDIVLFDVILMAEGDTRGLDDWLRNTATTSDRTRPDPCARIRGEARAHGVEWRIDLGIKTADLCQVIHEAVTGTLEASTVADEWVPAEYAGQPEGLSRREAAVIEMIVKGESNQEIADALFLSINSVKTYIRSAYRKMGVTHEPKPSCGESSTASSSRLTRNALLWIQLPRRSTARCSGFAAVTCPRSGGFRAPKRPALVGALVGATQGCLIRRSFRRGTVTRDSLMPASADREPRVPRHRSAESPQLDRIRWSTTVDSPMMFLQVRGAFRQQPTTGAYAGPVRALLRHLGPL